MKTQLVFPIFIFVPKDNMPYIFWEEKLYKTTNTLLIKKWKKNMEKRLWKKEKF
jgi:hypothetical protein